MVERTSLSCVKYPCFCCWSTEALQLLCERLALEALGCVDCEVLSGGPLGSFASE